MKTLKFDVELDSIASLKDPELCARLDVEVEASAAHEDEASVNGISIWSAEHNRAIELTELTEADQKRVEDLAWGTAQEHAYDVWFEGQVDRADAAYDAWKDGD